MSLALLGVVDVFRRTELRPLFIVGREAMALAGGEAALPVL